jgi:hypothetical protein
LVCRVVRIGHAEARVHGVQALAEVIDRRWNGEVGVGTRPEAKPGLSTIAATRFSWFWTT